MSDEVSMAITELWCPITVRSADGPRRQRAQADAIKWAETTALVRSEVERSWAAAWNVAEFTARVYGDTEDLSLATEWFIWMNLVDEITESFSSENILAELEPVINILRHDDPDGAGVASRPLVAAFADLWQRTRPGMSPAWRARVAHAWKAFVDATPWEQANRAAVKAPTVDAYLANRATAGGTYVALLLTEGLHKYELPRSLHHAGPLTALRTLAGDHICWSNDLLSLDREEHHGDVHNLVIVLEQALACDRSAAIEETVRMCNERMRSILAIVDSVPAYQESVSMPTADRQLMDRSVEDILQWIAGSLDFHQISTRHRDHNTRKPNPFRPVQRIEPSQI